MAIKNIIAKGIGFSPGSTKFIPTHGFNSAAAVQSSVTPSTSSSSESLYSYEIILTDDYGNQLADLSGFLSLNCSKVTNGMGFFELVMPPSFDQDLINLDRMVQIWRQPRGGVLTLWQVYFLRRWSFPTRGSEEHTILQGPDINHLLFRRIVAAYSGSSQASKTDFADDIMKEVVTESLADGIEPVPDAGTRVWSDLSIASDLSLGPTITKSFPFDKLLTKSNRGVLPLLGKAAKEEGTEVFFDIVPNVITGSSIDFIFNTYIDQPRQNVSDSVTFSKEDNNLDNPNIEYDYTFSENYMYGTGQNRGAARIIKQAYDSDRYNLSQWNRIEGEADARNQSSPDGVLTVANDKLNEGRPKVRFTGAPLDTKGTRFGIDWDWGYKVRVKHKNIEFDSIIKAVTLDVSEDGENVGAKFEFEALL